MKKVICLALLAGLFLFANSCHDEVANDEELTLKSGKLKRDVTAEMKSQFESNHEVNKFLLFDYIDQIKWESAQVMEIDNSTVVEVQVKLKGKYEVMSEKDPLLNLDYRLLFIEKNGTIASYMEYLISKKEPSYLQDTKKASYLKRDGSFEGTIVLEDSKNEFSTIYHSTGDSQELRLKDLPTVCIGLYENFSDGTSVLIEILYCTSSGGGDDGGGSVGGGGGSTNPTTNPTPKTNQILKTNYLNQTQTNLLETALSSLINEHCMTQSAYNMLVNNVIKLDFKMNTLLSIPASYNPTSKSISFRSNSDINSASLKEELFHAAQDAFYPGGTAQYTSTGKVNIEFEAKLYKDIMAFPCCGALNIGTAPENIINSYNIWVYSIQDNPSNISDSDYQYWLNQFNTYTPDYSSPTSSNLSSPNALKSIISICH
jgi:hypothetical protein